MLRQGKILASNRRYAEVELTVIGLIPMRREEESSGWQVAVFHDSPHMAPIMRVNHQTAIVEIRIQAVPSKGRYGRNIIHCVTHVSRLLVLVLASRRLYLRR
jgi:hypothetical protein